MSWNSVAESAIRGLVAASRGALEGQVAALQSKNQRALAESQMALGHRQLDIQEHGKLLDDAFKREELGEKGRQADQADATTRFVEMLTIDGKIRMMDMQTGREVDWRKYAQDAETERSAATDATQERIGERKAEAQEYTADKSAEASKYSAEQSAEASKYGADKSTEASAATDATRVEVAEIQAQAAESVAEQNYLATVAAVAGKGEQDRLTLQEEYTIAKQVRADRLANRALLGAANVVPTLQKEARDWALRIVKDVQASESYKYLESAQLQWEVIESGAEGFGGMSDLALVNAFQRMIDPGVSVREGDVSLQLATSSYLEQLKLLEQRITAGPGDTVNILTPTARAGLIGTAMSILNGQIDAFYNKRMVSANNLLQTEPEIAAAGLTFEQLVPDIFQKVSANPFKIAGVAEANWPLNPHEAGISAEEKAKRAEFDDPKALFGTPGSYRWRNNIDSIASNGVQRGVDSATLRQEIETTFRQAGQLPNHEYIGLILNRFAKLLAEQPEPEPEPEPETPQTQDAVEPPKRRSRQGGRSLVEEEDDDAEQ